jgi:hypothetical protein
MLRRVFHARKTASASITFVFRIATSVNIQRLHLKHLRHVIAGR